MPYPIFVLEGPDNSGKSTLANVLAAKCGGKIIHSTYRWKDKMYLFHLSQFRRALKHAQERPVILDRWWPSEIAYANTYRDGPSDDYDLDHFTRLGKQYFVSYTYCFPTRWEQYWQFFLDHYDRDVEMYPPNKERYRYLWKVYRELALNQYSYYPQNLIQHYNVVIDQHRGDSFARYIIARAMNQMRILTPEEKEGMRQLSDNWRDIRP